MRAIHPIESLIADKDDLSFLTEAPYFMSVREEVSEDGHAVWVVDYDQINSPRRHPIVDECRGIVICKETRKVVCWPFRRFYNLGEYPEHEKEFDWESAFCQSKEDGSLIKVYFYKGKWRIATRGTAFGHNTITNLMGESADISFRNLFLRAINCTEEQFQHDMTYNWMQSAQLFFELCTSENRVVTRYDRDLVFHIGTRGGISSFVETATQHDAVHFEGSPSWAHLPAEVNMSSFDEALKAAAELKELREGFVLCDGKGMRLKVKSPTYVIAHHVRGNQMTPKRAVELVLMNEHHEFIAYFPEYEEYVMKFSTKLTELELNCQLTFKINRDIESQKEFALAVKDLPYSGIMFSMRQGKSFWEAFDHLSQNAKYRLLGAD